MRTSLMKNFQSASVHSSHSPFSRRAMRWKQTRCAVTRSNCLPRSGKGVLRIDSRDDAANPKNLVVPRKKGSSSGSSPRSFVAEQTAKIEKISGAAAEIQDVERRRAIKPEVLYAFYVNANPVVGVLVGVDLSRVRPIRIMFAQPYQFRFINRGENSSRAYRVRPAASVLPQTFRRVAGKELLKFSRKSHGKTMQRRGADTQGATCSERTPSLLDVYSNQTRRAFPGHKSACPAVARIEVLLIAPQHFQFRAGRLFPTHSIVQMPFP